MINKTNNQVELRLFLTKVHAKWIFFFLLCILIFPFYLHYKVPHPGFNDPVKFAPSFNISIQGKVYSYPRITEGTTKFIIEVIKINGKISIGFIQVSMHTPEVVPKIGALIIVRGDLKATRRDNYGKYLSRKSIFTIFSGRSIEYISQSQPNFWWERLTETHLNEPYGSLRLALILGDRVIPLKKEFQDIFRESGLAHIVAASGQNLSLIFILINFCISKKVSKITSLTLTLLVCIGFTAIAGFSPSIIRAAFMISFSRIFKLFFIKKSIVFYLFITFLMMLCIDPFYIYDIGFQLSITAVFCIITLSPLLQNLFNLLYKLPVWISELIFIPICASIGTQPILFLYFQRITPWGIVSNILAAPLVMMCTWLSLIVTISYFIFGGSITKYFEFLVYPFFYILFQIAYMFSYI